MITSSELILLNSTVVFFSQQAPHKKEIRGSIKLVVERNPVSLSHIKICFKSKIRLHYKNISSSRFGLNKSMKASKILKNIKQTLAPHAQLPIGITEFGKYRRLKFTMV